MKKFILGSLALLMLCGCNAKQEDSKPVDEETVVDNVEATETKEEN